MTRRSATQTQKKKKKKSQFVIQFTLFVCGGCALHYAHNNENTMNRVILSSADEHSVILSSAVCLRLSKRDGYSEM